jgi:hypothetical protein
MDDLDLPDVSFSSKLSVQILWLKFIMSNLQNDDQGGSGLIDSLFGDQSRPVCFLLQDFPCFNNKIFSVQSEMAVLEIGDRQLDLPNQHDPQLLLLHHKILNLPGFQLKLPPQLVDSLMTYSDLQAQLPTLQQPVVLEANNNPEEVRPQAV